MKDPRRNELKKRLGIGFWVDQNDHLHVSITELLELFELPETPANISKMYGLVELLMNHLHPDTNILHRSTPEE